MKLLSYMGKKFGPRSRKWFGNLAGSWVVDAVQFGGSHVEHEPGHELSPETMLLSRYMNEARFRKWFDVWLLATSGWKDLKSSSSSLSLIDEKSKTQCERFMYVSKRTVLVSSVTILFIFVCSPSQSRQHIKHTHRMLLGSGVILKQSWWVLQAVHRIFGLASRLVRLSWPTGCL